MDTEYFINLLDITNLKRDNKYIRTMSCPNKGSFDMAKSQDKGEKKVKKTKKDKVAKTKKAY